MTEAKPPEPGTCDACGKAPGSVRVRRVSAGEEVDENLCHACARERGLESEPGAGGSDLVSLMLQSLNSMEGVGGVCDGCGLTYSQFRETGRLGCAACYRSFLEDLRPLLRRIHGEIRHLGKVPRRTGSESDRSSRLRRLNEDLERAIGAEEYERAAEIRDRIQELEMAPPDAGRDSA